MFFALPTMSTGDAMFPRPMEWLDRLPAPEQASRSVLLAHSEAVLSGTFADLIRSSRPIAAVEVDGGARVAACEP